MASARHHVIVAEQLIIRIPAVWGDAIVLIHGMLRLRRIEAFIAFGGASFFVDEMVL